MHAKRKGGQNRGAERREKKKNWGKTGEKKTRGENGKKTKWVEKKGKPRKTEKRQHTEKKPKREHEPNKDYTERSIAFTIAFVPVDNEKPRKQAGGKRGRETGEKRGRQRNHITEGLKDEKQTQETAFYHRLRPFRLNNRGDEQS